MTVWALFLFMAAGAIGAAAVDVTYLYSARTQLQVSADIAAHAALFRRSVEDISPEAAQADAIRAVRFGMPEAAYGDTVRTTDILFGTYDRATDAFRVDPDAKDAVLVTAHRDLSHGNPVATFLFRLAGLGRMDVGASSVAETYQPGCLAQGFAAEGVIDIQSNSTFTSYCLHSNSHIKAGNGNSFLAGSVVSMPDTSKLQIGGSGFEQNPGLREALRDDEYEIRVLDRIRATAADPLDAALMTPGDDDRPTYIGPYSSLRELGTGGSTSYSTADVFSQGHVHTRWCNSPGNSLTISGPSSGMTYKNFVLITNCLVSLSGNVKLENVLLYTSNTSDTSVTVSTAGGGGGSSDGLWLGRNDTCAFGSGAQIITRGGFRNSAALYLYGAQIVALGPVQFSSNATGEGAAITTGSTISGTSRLTFKRCPGTMDQRLQTPYLRLVR